MKIVNFSQMAGGNTQSWTSDADYLIKAVQVIGGLNAGLSFDPSFQIQNLLTPPADAVFDQLILVPYGTLEFNIPLRKGELIFYNCTSGAGTCQLLLEENTAENS